MTSITRFIRPLSFLAVLALGGYDGYRFHSGGWESMVVVQSAQGLINWEEHLWGHWHWWERLIELFAWLFTLAIGLAVGWGVGLVWNVRRFSDLPEWIRKRAPDDSEFPDLDETVGESVVKELREHRVRYGLYGTMTLGFFVWVGVFRGLS
jgi:hypothetical protein